MVALLHTVYQGPREKEPLLFQPGLPLEADIQLADRKERK